LEKLKFGRSQRALPHFAQLPWKEETSDQHANVLVGSTQHQLRTGTQLGVLANWLKKIKYHENATLSSIPSQAVAKARSEVCILNGYTLPYSTHPYPLVSSQSNPRRARN
jgi:hypothetical protein